MNLAFSNRVKKIYMFRKRLPLMLRNHHRFCQGKSLMRMLQILLKPWIKVRAMNTALYLKLIRTQTIKRVFGACYIVLKDPGRNTWQIVFTTVVIVKMERKRRGMAALDHQVLNKIIVRRASRKIHKFNSRILLPNRETSPCL